MATAQPEKARVFYGDVLGLRFIEDDGSALVFHVGGIVLRLQKVQALTPQPFTVMGWVVPDVAMAVAGLKKKGVTFERYAWMGGADVWIAPGGSLVAWFKDPEGNLLSLTQKP